MRIFRVVLGKGFIKSTDRAKQQSCHCLPVREIRNFVKISIGNDVLKTRLNNIQLTPNQKNITPEIQQQIKSSTFQVVATEKDVQLTDYLEILRTPKPIGNIR